MRGSEGKNHWAQGIFEKHLILLGASSYVVDRAYFTWFVV
jgi:hypothetical protein